MKGFFVTGTDTEVGKTVVSSILMSQLRRKLPVCYWKPVQTGIEEDDDTKTVKRLAKLTESEVFDQGIRLERPLSPHLAARLANVKISIANVLKFLENADSGRFFIVEGAGGVYVPLNSEELMVDLIKALKLPVIIAARAGLGTINHTCLTIAAIRSLDIEIAGVIMNGEQNPENRAAIEQFGKVKVIGEVPRLKNLSAEINLVSEFKLKMI